MKKKQTKTRRGRMTSELRRFIKDTFVPHSRNQYRPHLVRRYGIGIVMIAILILHGSYNYSVTGTVLGDQARVSSDELLKGANGERSPRGLPLLTMDSKLSEAAFLKAQDMFNRQYWAHNAPDGTTPWQWVNKVGYNYSYAGENLAKGFQGSTAVTAAWMASPEHRANVLNENYTQVGIAVVDGVMAGNRTTLVVALYGAPVGTTVAGAQIENMATQTLQPENLVTRLGVLVQTALPAAVGSVVILLAGAFIAITAHAYRKKLPKNLRQTWYQHHGIIKAGGMVSLCIVIVLLYSGGQI